MKKRRKGEREKNSLRGSEGIFTQFVLHSFQQQSSMEHEEFIFKAFTQIIFLYTIHHHSYCSILQHTKGFNNHFYAADRKVFL
jgi:hypothetical protein